ncbi:protein MCM10 homolog [Copidosoma floridanum]|uniref:protein MCM10 homolog n=1 Tax=Copidosoma floridanum TaxID=29053 RepID=UPI0006C99F78|nr:protein MCM10 homolog [Copidosoma floridanum]
MSDSDSDSELLASLLSSAAEEDSKPVKPSTVTVSEQSKLDSEPDSDDELLATLLGTDDDNGVAKASQKSTDTDASTLSKTNFLREYNFLDDTSDDVTELANKTQTPKKQKKSTLANDNADSSDEEDSKYFEQQRYSEYGKDIKRLIKTKESEKEGLSSSFTKENSYSSPAAKTYNPPLSNSFKTKASSSSLSNSFSGLSEKSDKYSLQAEASTPVTKDVYSDPIFGLRIVKPLVSSADLVEKMQGRKPVTVSAVKQHLLNVSSIRVQEDWVIGGVILSKSATRTSVKGSQYCIWKISDLSTEMNTVSVFMFSGAYKYLWKLPTGTAVIILNPTILENKDGKDLATLSVDNERKVMVLGSSKDLSKCRSMKKNGEPCTAPVNLRFGEYCVYHVKQEYGKFSKRTDIQSHGLGRTIGQLGSLGQAKKPPTSLYQQRHPEAQPFVAVLAKRNEVQVKKDRERLAMLRGDAKALEQCRTQAKMESMANKRQVKSISVELTAHQTKKDLEKLNKLRGWGSEYLSPGSQLEKKSTEAKMMLSTPKLGNGAKGGFIDFSESTPKSYIHRAKLNALEYVRKNGMIQKLDPNQSQKSKEILRERGIKRRREEEAGEGETMAEKVAKKELAVKNRFQEMLEKKSAHMDLVEKHEDEETELYFRKQLAKERMEEKMLTTFKIACKAVQCKICKYTAFSGSDLCKKLQHPLKVFDAVKRFFKCGECGNRTVSLDRIPMETCKRCSSSKWLRAAMMDDKKTQLPGSKLSIRGAEEKYIGATVSGDSLDLLVPEND